MVVASPGTEFVVRYLFDGTIFGFTTHLVHKQQDPFPMWVFHYPTVVEVKTLRRSPRINMTVPVKNADGRVFQSRDVSAHGALLAINGKIVIGNRLELSFNLPDGTVIENLGAEVVRVQESREETLAGVNFAESDHEQVNKIAAYLYSGKN
jgi:c-di-GMP-binding flagellar brake protein YcgR